MEPPAIINANSMRDEVAKVMHSLRPLTQDDVEHNLVLGQYIAAEIDGKEVKGYLQRKRRASNSRTETFGGFTLRNRKLALGGRTFLCTYR